MYIIVALRGAGKKKGTNHNLAKKFILENGAICSKCIVI